ncbi:MAG: cation-translocating P-type ATPase [Clostridiales bacterium]|jgi:heavy metal translocating P-type ATPase|nr:cation-translocating P-type ATPase [Clostridiales bacterium]
MINFLKDGNKRTLAFLCVSFVSLCVSLAFGGGAVFDAAWVAVLLCGIPIVKGAATGLVTEFDITADVLVAIALTASVVIGEVFAAGEIAFIMTIGAFLEERTVAKARAGIGRLARLTPATARVSRNGAETIVPAEQVNVGDTLIVLAGEVIAVDGVITKGETSVDQSAMTGESVPVDKKEGDAVRSGTVNQFGAFEMRAVKVSADSSMQRLTRLVEAADAGKAKIVGAADRWAVWIVGIALAAALTAWLVTGELLRAVTILVVFCPCALALATPAAIMAGIGNAARRGILVSRGDALERLARVKRIAFDKTGTLTLGKLSVARVRSGSGISDEELLAIVASAETRSEHPIGKAIAAHYTETYHRQPAQPEVFALLPGRGVAATVNGGKILAGNEALLAAHGLTLPKEYAEDAARYLADGCTVVYAANDSGLLGFIALSDTIRANAAATVRQLHATGLKTVLLTGDAPHAANRAARLAGITDVMPECLPEDKLTAIEAYQRGNEPVCMVGDGINDAPALKTARAGIAMGGVGSGIAVEAADIALVGDDLQAVPHLIALSKRVMRTIHINLTASMLLNLAAVVLAATGNLNPVAGALVHNAGSVAVVLNSSRLLKWRDKRTAKAEG